MLCPLNSVFFLSKQPILFLLKKNSLWFISTGNVSPLKITVRSFIPLGALCGYLMESQIFPHNRQEQGFGPDSVPGDILHEILEIKIKIFVCSQRTRSKDEFDHLTSLLLLPSKGSNGEIPPLDKCTVVHTTHDPQSPSPLWCLQHGASQSVPWRLSPSCSWSTATPAPVSYLSHITALGNSHLMPLYPM